MKPKRKTQLERIRGRLHERGHVTRNECLRYFITRCAARIADLEKQGYVFRTEDTGRDYVYHLVSIGGVPYQKPVKGSCETCVASKFLVANFETA
jgi:hypothetical protein